MYEERSDIVAMSPRQEAQCLLDVANLTAPERHSCNGNVLIFTLLNMLSAYFA